MSSLTFRILLILSLIAVGVIVATSTTLRASTYMLWCLALLFIGSAINNRKGT